MSPRLTRRAFLAASTSLGLLASVPAHAEDYENWDDLDLRFDLSDDRRYLRITVLRAESQTESGTDRAVVEMSGSTPTAQIFWDLDARWFGPEARLVLFRLESAPEPAYRLRIDGVRYGRDPARQLAFDFRTQDSEGRRRYAIQGWSTLFSSGLSGSLFPLGGGRRAGPLDFESFVVDRVPLEGDPQYTRVRGMLRRVFNGLVQTAPHFPRLRGGADGIRLQLLSNGDWRLGDDEARPAPFHAGSPDMPQGRLDLRWCVDDRDATDFKADFGVLLLKSELATYCAERNRQIGEAVVALGEPPLAINLAFGDGTARVALDFTRDETGKPEHPPLVLRAGREPDSGRHVAELALRGSWHVTTESGAERTGPFRHLTGRLMRRSVSGPGEGDPRRFDSTLSFDGRWRSRHHHRVTSPIGGLCVGGVVADEADDSSDSFGPRNGDPVRLALTGTDDGSGRVLRLDWFEATAELWEADFALPDAQYSKLAFAGSEVNFLYDRAPPQSPLRGSFVHLNPLATAPIGRLDLSRARLYAARADDLVSLTFGFTNLGLEIEPTGIEIVSYSQQCGSFARAATVQDMAPLAPPAATPIPEEDPDAEKNGATAPEVQTIPGAQVDTRPILVVEFPPQHVMEQAYPLPAPPAPPDVAITRTAAIAGRREPQGPNGTWTIEIVDEEPPQQGAFETDAFTIDPNNRDDIGLALSRLSKVADRAALRQAVRDLKRAECLLEERDVEKAAACTAPRPDDRDSSPWDFARFEDAFRKCAEDFAPPKPARCLPADQQIYIGPYLMAPDAAHVARQVHEAVLASTIQALVDGMLREVKGQARAIMDDGPPPSVARHADDFGSALALEGLLESAMPNYQMWRNAWRDFMLDRLVDASDLEVDPRNLEYVVDLDGSNRKWIGQDDWAKHPLNRFVDAFGETYLAQLTSKVLPKGMAEGRLSRPSRLAFRVNCRDVLAVERAKERAVQIDEDAVLGLGLDRFGFTLESLTDWSSMELSVVRRAANVYSPGAGGRLDDRSSRRRDYSEASRLDDLGFPSGKLNDAATRLAHIQKILSEPPSPDETAIEIPARLQLSPSQSAVFLTRRKVPDAIFAERSMPLRDSTSVWAEADVSRLFSARLASDGFDAGIRAVHSPDFRSNFAWTALADLQGQRLLGGANRIPGIGAPMAGPVTPWLVGPEETVAQTPSARAIFDRLDQTLLDELDTANVDAETGETRLAMLTRELGEDKSEEAFCRAVRAEADTGRPYVLPGIVAWICERAPYLRGWGARDDGTEVPAKVFDALRFFRTGLDANDRHQLVVLTSAHGLPVIGRYGLDGEMVANSSQVVPDARFALSDVMPGSAIYRPRPLVVSEMMLTTLGGSLRLDTSFEPPAGALHISGLPLFDALSVERWQQWTVLGRDVFTEVVYKGFLFPLGHRASLVKVTERTFIRDCESKLIRAYLRQRLFIRCGKPVKFFPAVGQANRGRGFPVNRLTLLTVQTPDLVDPYASASPPSSPDSPGQPVALPSGRITLAGAPGLAFWPRTATIDGAEVRFEVDLDGNPSHLPLIFVDNVAANSQSGIDALVRYYNKLPSPDMGADKVADAPIRPLVHRRTMRFAGQKHRYAPEIETGSASVETDAWTLRAEGRETLGPSVRPAEPVDDFVFQNDKYVFSSVLQGVDQPPFYPWLDTARVRLRQNERLTGKNQPPVRARLDGHFVANGLPEPEPPETAPPLAELPETEQVEGSSAAMDHTAAAQAIGNGMQIFLTLIDQPMQSMGKNGDNSGGMFRPAGSLVALSRTKGPVSRANDVPGTKLDPNRSPELRDTLLPSLARAHTTRPQAGEKPPLPRGSRKPVTGAPARDAGPSELEEVLAEFEKIYRNLFTEDAKLLGLVSLRDLLGLLAGSNHGKDPARGVPEMVEKVRYGLGQAAGEIENAADDTTGFVRETVLEPLLDVIEQIRKSWDAIDDSLASGQRRVSPAQPILLREVFPELSDGLTGFQSALARSIATTDSVLFALSLAEVYEAGQRFLRAIQTTASDPVGRIEDAFASRLDAISRIGLDFERYFAAVVQETANGLGRELQSELAWMGSLANEISILAVPETGAGDGEPYLFLPLPYPDFLARLPDSVPADIRDRAARIGETLRVTRGEARGLVQTFALYLFGGVPPQDILRGVPDQSYYETFKAWFWFREENKPIVEILEQTISHRLGLARDELDALLDDLSDDAEAEVEMAIGGALKEYEAALLGSPLDRAREEGAAIVLQFTPYFNRIDRIARRVRAAIDAVKAGDFELAAQNALLIVEEFTGPLDVDVAAICDGGTPLGQTLAAAAEAFRLDGAGFCRPTFPAGAGPLEAEDFCRVDQDGTIANFAEAAAGTGNEICNAILSWHGQVSDAADKLEALDLEARLDDIDETEFASSVAAVRDVGDKTATMLGGLRGNLATLYCELINDALALEVLERQFATAVAALNTGFCQAGAENEINRLPDHVELFLSRRATLLRNFVENIETASARIMAWAGDSNVQAALGGAGIVAVIDQALGADDKARLEARLQEIQAETNAVLDAMAQSTLATLHTVTAQLATLTGRLRTGAQKAVKDVEALIANPYIAGTETLLPAQARAALETLGELDSYAIDLSAHLDAARRLEGSEARKALVELATADLRPNMPSLRFYRKGDATPAVPSLPHLIDDIEPPIKALLVNLSAVADALLGAAETEVFKRLDALATQALVARAEGLPISATDLGLPTALQVTIDKHLAEDGAILAAYEVLRLLRGELIKAADGGPFHEAVHEALRVDPRVPGFAIVLEEEEDRLDQDVKGLRRAVTTPAGAPAPSPVGSSESRAFLAAFVREWLNGPTSTPAQILKNVKNIVVDVLRGQIFEQLPLAAIRDQIESELLGLVPSRIDMSYDFSTPLDSSVKSLTAGIFEPIGKSTFEVETRIGIDLADFTPEIIYRSESRIGRFNINLVGGFKAVTLIFAGARFVTETGAEARFEVAYEDFEIGKQLEFVQALASYFTPKSGSGFYLEPIFAPIGIEAGYTLALGTISIGTVSFFNVAIAASARLPFEDADARFRGSLSRRLSPFTISAAPYGGSGFFAIEANATGIVGFEASFEYGGAGAFAFGPLTGQGRIMAGLYIRQTQTQVGRVTEISGTFFAGGSANIWIFSLGASLYVRLGMVNGDMSGEATFTFSFSIGIKDFEYSVQVWRQEGKGFSNASQASLIPPAGTRLAARLERAGRLAALGDGQMATAWPGPNAAIVETDTVSPEENWGRYRSYFDRSLEYEDSF